MTGDDQLIGDEDAGHAEGEGAEQLTARERKALHEIVHTWIPLGIVLISVLAAVTGWRASLSDEKADHGAEQSRQALVLQQQLIVQDNQAIDSDLQTFGQFSQQSSQANALRQEARKGPSALRVYLQAQSQSDLATARFLGRQIAWQNYTYDPTNPTGNPALEANGTYAPGHPYLASAGLARAENADTELHGLSPDALLKQAEAVHSRAVEFEGVAALLVSVMFLLTVAALSPALTKLWLTGGATVVVLGAVVLFCLIQFTPIHA